MRVSNAETDRPRRVLHVFGVMDRGGAEMRTVELMRATQGVLVHEYATLKARPGVLDDEIARLGGAVHPCALDAAFPARFIALCRRRRVNAVHSHVHLTSGGILALAALARVPNRIAHFRTTSDERGDHLQRLIYRNLMRRLIDRYATSILGVSRAALDFGWKVGWANDPRCRVIPNGVDPSRFAGDIDRGAVRAELGIPSAAPIILHVGRFAWVKNQPRAVDLFAATAASNGAHLVFLGRFDGADSEVRARIDQHGLSDRVHLLGERADVPRWMRAADLLLLTSHYEGMPGVVIEARAAGLPVVASDLPGVVEIAEHLPGITVVPNKASDTAWAAAIEGHLASPISESSRAAARIGFASSRFAIGSAVEEMRMLWLR